MGTKITTFLLAIAWLAGCSSTGERASESITLHANAADEILANDSPQTPILTPTTPPAQNQSEAMQWGMTDDDFVDYALALPNDSLAIVQVTSDGQGAFVDNAQLVPYQLAIRYYLFRASTGRVVINTSIDDIFGPIDVSSAFAGSCSGVNLAALFDLLNAHYPSLANYRRIIILHNSTCEYPASAAGTAPNVDSDFFYLRSRNSLPYLDGEDTGLPAIGQILSGLLLTYGTSSLLAHDGAYDSDWNFPLDGPGTLTNYTMNTHAYSIMGDISQVPNLLYLLKFPSPANLELAGWLADAPEVIHYTKETGPLTVQLHNYLRSRQAKVLKIDYGPATIYVYYNRAAHKLIFDYGPFASAYFTLTAAQQVTTLDAVVGRAVTFMNVPSFDQQPVTVEITSVAASLDNLTISIHP